MSKAFKDIAQSKWLIFGLFAIIVIIKNVLFQNAIFDDLYVGNFIEAFKFYGGITAFSIFLASFILISKHKPWWSVLLSLLIDVWCMALTIYYRSWGIWMNIEVIKMADNMSGFWSSVWTYTSSLNWLLFALTILYALLLYLIPATQKKRYWKSFLLVLVLAYCYVPARQFVTWRKNLDNLRIGNPYTDTFMYHAHNVRPLFKPYNSVKGKAYVSYISGGMAVWEDQYIRRQGFVDYALAMTVFQLTYDYHCWKNRENEIEIVFTEEEKLYLDTIVTKDTCTFIPQRSLIFLLVESLESWVIDYEGEGGYAMPNLRLFMNNHHHFYADKLTSQAKFGGSGDGQCL